MKIKSNPSATFVGLGELVAPFARSFPNIGAVVGNIVNNSGLPVNIMIRKTGTGYELYSVASDGGGAIGSAALASVNSYANNVSGEHSKFTATRSGGAWVWAERNANSDNVPFGTENLTVGSVVNRLWEPKITDTVDMTDAVDVYVLQSIEVVFATQDDAISSDDFDIQLLGSFVSDSLGFGE
jgi:hypothetical protein